MLPVITMLPQLVAAGGGPRCAAVRPSGGGSSSSHSEAKPSHKHSNCPHNHGVQHDTGSFAAPSSMLCVGGACVAEGTPQRRPICLVRLRNFNDGRELNTAVGEKGSAGLRPKLHVQYLKKRCGDLGGLQRTCTENGGVCGLRLEQQTAPEESETPTRVRTGTPLAG